MKLLVFFLLLLNLSIALAQPSLNAVTSGEIEYPRFHIFINDKEKSRIMATCKEVEQYTITCHFEITTIKHNKLDALDDEIKSYAGLSEDNMQTLVNDNQKRMCNKSPMQHVEGKEFIVGLRNDFCKSPSRKTLMSFINGVRIIEQGTCTMNQVTYDHKFTYNPMTKQWGYNETGDGFIAACGIIEIAYIEKDPRDGYKDFSWNYTVQAISTNKSQSVVGVKCSDLEDEKPVNYYGYGSNNYDANNRVDCKYVDLSQF